MKYAVEMSSGAMIYIPGVIKFGSVIQKLISADSQPHRQHGNRIGLLEESRVKSHNILRVQAAR
jgi:hypothetical protein